MDNSNTITAAIESRVASVMNTNEKRALALLGAGCKPVQVAEATGLSESYISQLMSDAEFSAEVSKQRFDKINKHNIRDEAYDTLEDAAIERLADALPFATKPLEIMRITQFLNSAKRRGQGTSEGIASTAVTVQLLMPTTIVQKFTTNINNQVIAAGTQTLETVQSHALLAAAKQKQEGLQNALPHTTFTHTVGSVGSGNSSSGRAQEEYAIETPAL